MNASRSGLREHNRLVPAYPFMKPLPTSRLLQAGLRLTLLVAIGACLLPLISTVAATLTDANGNALPGSGDGKETVLDNSKDESAPPVERSKCAGPNETEFRAGFPGWMAGLSGDFGIKGILTS